MLYFGDFFAFQNGGGGDLVEIGWIWWFICERRYGDGPRRLHEMSMFLRGVIEGMAWCCMVKITIWDEGVSRGVVDDVSGCDFGGYEVCFCVVPELDGALWGVFVSV